ncbi:MAG: low molecular weight protein-tyrosine-phosphatase [Myxococcota bacterium]|nr:low molecular weight protein-tyrosine-phosphatase [Myxococcota bacterium]
MRSPTRVLFVCLGNICRSPLAEGAFVNHVKTAGLKDQFTVDSAGTSGYHAGELPDKRSIDVARAHGVDITMQRSRALTRRDFKTFQYIVAMDRANLANIRRVEPADSTAEISLMLSEVSHDAADVPDPYYGGVDGFETVWQMVDRATGNLLKRLIQEQAE